MPIKTIGVAKSYDGLEVLKDVNFTVIRHQRIVLIGPNGSGKSTFIKILLDTIHRNLKLLFSGSKVLRNVGSLSGGQKTRLSLDVLSQRVILEALKEYKGTMIVVSHTPGFIKELSPNKAFLFPEQKMVFWEDGLLDRINEV